MINELVNILKTIVVIIYGSLLKLNETQLEENMKFNKVVVQAAILMEVLMKVKKIHGEMKNVKMILVK